MVKTGRNIKLTIITFSMMILLFLLIFSHQVAVSSGDTWAQPEQLYQATSLPFSLPNGDVIVDNFEYWDNPLNHGWTTNEPPYPIWGEDIGYGRLMTVLDTIEVSRVLNVYMPPSVFLPNFQRFAISKALASPDPADFVNPDPNNNPSQSPQCTHLSFKIRAPLTVEMFDSFTFIIQGTLKDPLYRDKVYYYAIRLIPRENCPGCDDYQMDPVLVSDPTDDPKKPGVINVEIGRQYADWTWHTIYVDIQDTITQSLGTTGKYLRSIDFITIQGNRYRLDDIIFHTHDHRAEEPPYIFKIGPLFAQLFTRTQRLVYATDDVCNQNDVLIDPNEICDAYIQDSRAGFIDPNIARDWDADPDKDYLRLRTRYAALIDTTRPVLADCNMRTSRNNHEEDMLRFYAYIGKGGAHGSLAPGMIRPLEVNPDDEYPLFLPAYYRLTGDEGDPVVEHACGCSLGSEGTFYYPPERVRNIELALQHAGYKYWPRVAVLEFCPQVLEDLIVTVEVSDGRTNDIETFPVSVVNYPVENYPPCMEDLDDQIAYVGEVFEYALSAVDPDSCIYSPTHPRFDQFNLTWSMTIASLPSYQFGPWNEQLIDPRTGLIRFTPQFEGVYPVVVTVQDDRGLFNIGRFVLHCVNRGTWLNHPPVVLGDWDHPQVCRAGEMFILSEPTLDVVDPDGDKVYYTCDIGAIGVDANGHAIWSFQTQFPGFYAANIFAMDTHGAFTVFTIHLEVRPWWSM
ncbi:MAG: hypothetical protein AB1611_22110 [bacterium]